MLGVAEAEEPFQAEPRLPRTLARPEPGTVKQEVTPEAMAGTDHYYAAISVHGTIISNCQHKHRGREAAERCAVSLVALLSEPVRDLPRWKP